MISSTQHQQFSTVFSIILDPDFVFELINSLLLLTLTFFFELFDGDFVKVGDLVNDF